MYISAYYGPCAFLSVQSLTADSLDATNLYDYTGRVLELVSTSVESGWDIEQCCGYRFQMLDKYCSSRTTVHVQCKLYVQCEHICSWHD